MNTSEALKYINNFTWSKSRPGLSRIRELLKGLGNPQKRLKFIHVAGSNGKGSTCAMIESVLRAAGYKTGLYPSPYIEDFKESFQCCGEYITDDELCALTEDVRCVADKMSDHPSQFEIKTAIAFLFFCKRNCDIVVLETGMGGELDSTNVIDSPVAAVITNIGYDHTEYLGDTLEKIASAKAGIIKKGSPVIVYDNKPEIMDVIREACVKNCCMLHATHEDDITSIDKNLSMQSFKYKDIVLKMPLLGNNQLKNAAVALKTIEILKDADYNITEQSLIKGFETVKWPARFEVLSEKPLFILDGGHNSQCAKALAENLDAYVPDKKLTFIFGVLADKDYNEMLDIICPYAGEFICVTPESERALKAEELCCIIADMGFKARSVRNAAEAVRMCLDEQRDTVAFGSLYMAGDIRREFTSICK